MNDRILYCTGPNYSGSAQFQHVNGRYKLTAVPFFRELVKGVRMSEIEAYLTGKGYRVSWIAERV
jgi:hypothetical protein